MFPDEVSHAYCQTPKNIPSLDKQALAFRPTLSRLTQFPSTPNVRLGRIPLAVIVSLAHAKGERWPAWSSNVPLDSFPESAWQPPRGLIACCTRQYTFDSTIVVWYTCLTSKMPPFLSRPSPNVMLSAYAPLVRAVPITQAVLIDHHSLTILLLTGIDITAFGVGVIDDHGVAADEIIRFLLIFFTSWECFTPCTLTKRHSQHATRRDLA